jgi:hypothetical protein
VLAQPVHHPPPPVPMPVSAIPHSADPPMGTEPVYNGYPDVQASNLECKT